MYIAELIIVDVFNKEKCEKGKANKKNCKVHTSKGNSSLYCVFVMLKYTCLTVRKFKLEFITKHKSV